MSAGLKAKAAEIIKEAKIIENPNADKLLIVGFSPTSIADGVKFLETYPGCECWCMNMFYVQGGIPLSSVTRWFETHYVPTNPSVSQDSPEGKTHRQNLKCMPNIPLYVQDKEKYWSDFKNATEFPVEEILKEFPRKYFSSSPSWILALAYLEGIKQFRINGKFKWSKIMIAGIDMMSGWNHKLEVQPDGTQKQVDIVSNEYAMQRPSVEWLCGFIDSLKLMGQDCELIIPQASTILKMNGLYQYDEHFELEDTIKMKRDIETRINWMSGQINNLTNNMQQLQMKSQNELMVMQRRLDVCLGSKQELELMLHNFA